MRTHRKVNPKVKNGRVLKKNRHDLPDNYWNYWQSELQIDIEKPGKGYKHFLKKRDIQKFLAILPNWEELDVELNAVLLARGGDGRDGWYNHGIIGICAWEKDKSCVLDKDYFEEHKDIFDRLNVEYEIKKEAVIGHFTEQQIIAYQLLHIFLHELGHHHDRINTKDKNVVPRGEDYAESYARKYEQIIWNRFFEVFDMP